MSWGAKLQEEIVAKEAMVGRAVKLSLTEQLTYERQRLTERIAEIDEILAAMKAAPGVEKIIDLIFKQGIR